MSNYTKEEIERARAYYQRQYEAMRPIPTPQDIIDFDNKEKTTKEKTDASN